MKGSEQAHCACDTPRAEQIARLNDRLRKYGAGGAIMLTRGVRMMTGFKPTELLAKLAAYHGFDVDNDPHGERDFGDVEVCGTGLLWKIDYYSRDMKFASPDPADPEVTERILTVMLPEEW